MLPAFKPTVALKSRVFFLRSNLGLRTGPKTLLRFFLINSNLESLGFTGPGVAFGTRAFIKAEVTRFELRYPVGRL